MHALRENYPANPPGRADILCGMQMASSFTFENFVPKRMATPMGDSPAQKADFGTRSKKQRREGVARESLAPFFERISYHQGAQVAAYNGLQLSSAFQPIYSLSHQRPVGCEALLRARDEAGAAIPPAVVFSATKKISDLIFLDRLSRVLHIANYQALNIPGWLFLNVNPAVAINGKRMGSFLGELLERYKFPAHQVVIEVLENAIGNEVLLAETIDYYRNLGCSIAVDDFGAGHSNFERIWRLKPDIVKLDRKMIAEAMCDDIIRRSLPGLVSLLHEAGCIVLAEGVETESEVMMILDANVDLAQGYFFARPFPINDPKPMNLPQLRAIHKRFYAYSKSLALRTQAVLEPYITALRQAAQHIESGADVVESARPLLEFERAIRFYVLKGQGTQNDHNISRQVDAKDSSPRLLPLRTAKGANWSHRPYFRRAVDQPGEVQVTRPYLSLPDARMCLTLSLCIDLNNERCVLCFDIMSDPGC